MPDSKPNILVIWGDDIGITNLSCYSDGLMGYRTPNIDRIADEGMRFTDSYGEELYSRAVVVHHRSERVPHRDEQVGVPGRCRPAGRGSDHRRAAEAAGLRPPGSSGRTTSATSTSTRRPRTASTSSSATSTT